MITAPITLVFVDGTTPTIQIPRQQNLTTPQEVDVQIPFVAVKADGSPKDLTGWGSLTLTIRAGGTTGPVVTQLIATEGGTATGQITAAVTGVGHFIMSAVTARPLNGSYPFDVFSIDGAGLRDEPLPGSFWSFVQAVGAT